MRRLPVFISGTTDAAKCSHPTSIAVVQKQDETTVVMTPFVLFEQTDSFCLQTRHVQDVKLLQKLKEVADVVFKYYYNDPEAEYLAEYAMGSTPTPIIQWIKTSHSVSFPNSSSFWSYPRPNNDLMCQVMTMARCKTLLWLYTQKQSHWIAQSTSYGMQEGESLGGSPGVYP